MSERFKVTKHDEPSKTFKNYGATSADSDPESKGKLLPGPGKINKYVFDILCFGLLKACFRCLLSACVLHYNPVTAGKIVNACCVLHNIANTLLPPDEVHAEALSLQQEENNYPAPNLQEIRRVNRELLEGQALQQALVDRLWRNASL